MCFLLTSCSIWYAFMFELSSLACTWRRALIHVWMLTKFDIRYVPTFPQPPTNLGYLCNPCLLQEYSISSLETQAECKEQRKLLSELQTCLADAEFKVIEGEKLRKKLHNTILVLHFLSIPSLEWFFWPLFSYMFMKWYVQELKGNIRVFCRVRPLLPDENSTEQKYISYPTSMEVLGRGVDLVQNGMPLT